MSQGNRRNFPRKLMKYLKESNEIYQVNLSNVSRKPMKYLKETYELSQGTLRNISKKPNTNLKETQQLNQGKALTISTTPIKYSRTPIIYLQVTHHISTRNPSNISMKPIKFFQETFQI